MRSFFRKVRDESQKVLQGDHGANDPRSLENPEHPPPSAEEHEGGIMQSGEGTYFMIPIFLTSSSLFHIFSVFILTFLIFLLRYLRFRFRSFVSFHVPGCVPLQGPSPPIQCHPVTPLLVYTYFLSLPIQQHPRCFGC